MLVRAPADACYSADRAVTTFNAANSSSSDGDRLSFIGADGEMTDYVIDGDVLD